MYHVVILPDGSCVVLINVSACFLLIADYIEKRVVFLIFDVYC